MRSKPVNQAAKILGLVVLPVLILRMLFEKVLYLSRFNSFFPGDLFLALAVLFAQKAQKEYLPEEDRLTDRKTVRVAISIIAVMVFGLGQGLVTAASGKQSWEVFFLPSQLYHMILSYGLGGYIVSKAFLPLFHIKWSRDKCVAIVFLGLYIAMLLVDMFLGNPAQDYSKNEWQNQRLIVDFRK